MSDCNFEFLQINSIDEGLDAMTIIEPNYGDLINTPVTPARFNI